MVEHVGWGSNCSGLNEQIRVFRSSRLVEMESVGECCTDLVSAPGLVGVALGEAAMDAGGLVDCMSDPVAATAEADILVAGCDVGSSGSFANAEAGHQQPASH